MAGKAIRLFIPTGFIFIVMLLVACRLTVGFRLDFFRPELSGQPDNGKQEPAVPLHPLVFYDKQIFDRAVNKFPVSPAQIPVQSSSPRGGIIPHHLLASEIIADFFSRLDKDKIETIVVIGPNHFEKGDAKIISSQYGWQTPYGQVQPDITSIRLLEKNGSLVTNDAVLGQEHSIGGIMPFIKYYIPKAKVVPIAVSKKMNNHDTEALAAALGPITSVDNIVIVASVDFSHYLPAGEAEKKDKESLEAIISKDYVKILRFEHDNLDSPGSIITLLRLMDNIGAVNNKVLAHANSAEILKDFVFSTTSYYAISYH